MLLGCARSFNSHIDERHHAEPRRTEKQVSGLRPGDDFNQRGDSRAILEKYGWRLWRRGRLGEQWKRPDGKHGSATVFDDGSMFIFSTNALPFESERKYSPFAIYTTLEHGGNYEAAARALARDGYGEPQKPPENSSSKQTPDKALEVQVKAAEWPDLLPLPDGLLPVPSLPELLIPKTLRGWLTDIAERLQVPLEFPTIPAK